MEKLVSIIDDKRVKHQIIALVDKFYEAFLKDCEIYYDVQSKDDLHNMVQSLGSKKRADYFLNYFHNVNFDIFSFYSKDQMVFIKNQTEDPLIKYYNLIKKKETNLDRQQTMMHNLQKYEALIEKCYIFSIKELNEFKKIIRNFGKFLIQYEDQQDQLHKIEYYILALSVMF